MDTKKRIIGIGGGIASGKTHAGKIAKELGYHVIETSDLIQSRIAKKEGEKGTREECIQEAHNLVNIYGKGALGLLASRAIVQLLHENIVVCGLRNPEQIIVLKEHFQNTLFLYIDADQDIRVQRALKREKSKSKIGLSYVQEQELFKTIQHQIEGESAQQGNISMHLPDTKKASDILIENTTITLEAYTEKVKKLLYSIMRSQRPYLCKKQ